MLELKYIFTYVRDLLANTSEVWTRMRNNDKLKEGNFDYMFQHYYLPMMGVGAICIFLLSGFGIEAQTDVLDTFNLEHGMKDMVLFVVAYVAAVPLATLIIKELFKDLLKDIDKSKVELFVAYCISLFMLVELMCSFLPKLSFLSFAGLYVIYVVWLGSALYLQVDNRRLWIFTMLSFFAILGAPKFIEWLFSFLLRF